MTSKNNITMDSLKERAIRVYDGMTIVFPQFAQEEALNISTLAPKFNGCYAVNNSTVCFVYDNEIFVTPYTRTIFSFLESASFCEKCFFVPFSNGDYPKAEESKWNSLREMARQSYVEDFVEDCISYCDQHHIGTLPEETLQNCFEMPSTGVKVTHLHFEDCFYPIINTSYFNSDAMNRIGHFCYNNGKVVFVYRNGKTYVTKGYRILDKLRDAGYTEAGLFVPFSNGEEIQDPDLRAKWESIKK